MVQSLLSEMDQCMFMYLGWSLWKARCTFILDQCNMFKHKIELEYHLKRGHYREIPYERVDDVLGESAYVGSSYSEFHRLMRNGIPPPKGSIIPPEPIWEKGYETRAYAEQALIEAIEKKKKSKWWRSFN